MLAIDLSEQEAWDFWRAAMPVGRPLALMRTFLSKSCKEERAMRLFVVMLVMAVTAST